MFGVFLLLLSNMLLYEEIQQDCLTELCQQEAGNVI
jgi:hypothetical protein